MQIPKEENNNKDHVHNEFYDAMGGMNNARHQVANCRRSHRLPHNFSVLFLSFSQYDSGISCQIESPPVNTRTNNYSTTSNASDNSLQSNKTHDDKLTPCIAIVNTTKDNMNGDPTPTLIDTWTREEAIIPAIFDAADLSTSYTSLLRILTIHL